MAKRKKEKRIPALLLEDITNLGQRGEVVSLKPGYFRYLFNLGKARLATKEKLESELKPLLLEEKIKRGEDLTQKLKSEIEKLVLEFKVNKFTSITREKISKTLKEKGYQIPKSQIELNEKIKNPGEYEVAINLGYNIKTNLKIKVTI